MFFFDENMMSLTLPEIETKTDTKQQKPARVILYNDDVHTFDDVTGQLMIATHCSFEVGQAHAYRVHTQGRDIVFQGKREDCEKVAGILRRIRLHVEVDWD